MRVGQGTAVRLTDALAARANPLVAQRLSTGRAQTRRTRRAARKAPTAAGAAAILTRHDRSASAPLRARAHERGAVTRTVGLGHANTNAEPYLRNCASNGMMGETTSKPTPWGSHMSRRFFTLAVLVLVAVFAVAACDSGDASSDSPGAYTVKADEAVEMIEAGERTVIDVRTPAEYDEAHIVGALLIDVNGADFDDQIAGLDPDEPYLVYCRSGNRSATAAAQMEDAGIKDIADAGGLADLARAGAPVE